VLLTRHRRENVGGGFKQVCEAVRELAQRFVDHRFDYPVCMSPIVRGPVHTRLGGLANVLLIPPQECLSFIALMRKSRLPLTDSGGIQEEAPSLAMPVLAMRDTTELPEGVAAGTVRLVGVDTQRIVADVTRLLTDADAYRLMSDANNPYDYDYG
jgi:UDP-N-acetylglucosamine 2-epimerase (non-hydrolysing)